MANLSTRDIVAMLLMPGIGRRTIAKQIYKPDHDLPGLDAARPFDQRAATRQDWVDHLGRADAVLRHAQELDLHVLTPRDAAFPQQLKDIPDPPVILFVKGALSALTAPPYIAVVGTREPTPWGLTAARKLGRSLAERKSVVVSGLAKGCDTAAHEGCLDANGVTAAVLAHGLDKVYPAQNRPLANRIVASGGCLLSEYLPGEPARPSYFVERDRLQSGLACGVIVVESNVDGGAMHTARFCLDQNRILACVAHPPNLASHPKAAGTEMMIRQGKAFALRGKADVEILLHRCRKSPAASAGDL